MMAQTLRSDRKEPLVTVKEVFSQQLVGHKYFVDYGSHKCELQDELDVPVRTPIVDVVNLTVEAIEQLIAASGWSESWQVFSYWKPDAVRDLF
ncbi:MAG TPA: hypothetical protein DEV81_12365 [Cyanobacteria bacterium UBA11049]|nr:hypothetical protein [Cyanobacteria bacterium UBA11049]